MIRRLLCWLGIHEWQGDIYILRHGFRTGNRCVHCKTWSKTSEIVSVHDEQESK